jgi:hypothetical protein
MILKNTNRDDVIIPLTQQLVNRGSEGIAIKTHLFV